MNIFDLMTFPRMGTKNPEYAHDLSMFEVIWHGIDAAALIASGLWEWAPESAWLIRTKRGRKVWWKWAAKEGIV